MKSVTCFLIHTVASQLKQMIYISQAVEGCFSPENVNSVENEIQFENMLRAIKLTV